MASNTDAPKLYHWNWVWSDHGDQIISSNQKFPSRVLCQLDGLRHNPSIRHSELQGRTGFPQLKIKSSPMLEYKWIFIILDSRGEEIGRYAENKWYSSMYECIEASKNADFQLSDVFGCDMDFDIREKRA